MTYFEQSITMHHSTVAPEEKAHPAVLLSNSLWEMYCYFQNCLLAIRAPSAIAANFAHTTSGSTAACPTQVP